MKIVFLTLFNTHSEHFFLLPLYSGIEVWEGLHGVRSAINPIVHVSDSKRVDSTLVCFTTYRAWTFTIRFGLGHRTGASLYTV